MNFSFVSFSGHRDRTVPVSELDRIAAEFPGAVWVHGAAEGFDLQVDEYAKRHKIRRLPLPPCYLAYSDRNRMIVNAAPVLVVCYDGRGRGGTFHALTFAESLGKRVIRLELAYLPAPAQEPQQRRGDERE